MTAALSSWLSSALGTRVTRLEPIQSLWSGYGEIVRARLDGGARPSVIVKHVRPPEAGSAPTTSHARKVRSYEVESTFYASYAPRCGGARVAERLAALRSETEHWLVLEDLDAAGFPRRLRDPGGPELDACLTWLAAFHARFLAVDPEGLWPEGTYWHLETRREELARTHDAALRRRAPELDRRLREARYRTLVHGDAKPANFCFSGDGRAVAAVDFQYVGGGCGMRDVAYLLHRTGSPAAIERGLDAYFVHLRAALAPEVDADALELEWRALHPVAEADFERFLVGWRG